MTMNEVVLGGFIDELAGPGYVDAFQAEFRHLRCQRNPDNLIRYWRFESGKSLSKADQQRVESWHAGYRAALKNWRPADYT